MLIVKLSEEEAEKVKTSLIEFVVRVCDKKECATEAELQALPRIASLLLDSNG